MGNEPEKDLVPLPDGQVADLVLVHPLQISFVAGDGLTGPAGGGEEVHVLGFGAGVHKGDDAPVPVVRQGKAGLLPGFPEDALLRALPVLKLAAYTNPLVVVHIVFLLDPVEHQVLVPVIFQVAEGTVQHGLHVEAEVDHVAVLDHIVLALAAEKALVPGGSHRAAGHHIVVGDDLCPDEAPLDVGVDLTGGLGGLGAPLDGPGTALVLTVGEEGDKAQKGVGALDEAIQAGLLHVIGINTWIASSSGGSVGLGFAIPINNVKAAIDSLIDNGKVIYGWVGVSLIDVNDEYKEELGVGGQTGAFAGEVFTNSPAFKGGLRPGDFIVELNGKKVKDVNQLVREVGSLTAGSTARFGVIRGGKRIDDIKVRVEERGNDADINNSKMWPGFLAFPISEETRKDLDLDKRVNGVLVTNVQEKSAAAALRLQNGDVITAVNGKKVTNLKEFYNELSKAERSINFDVYTHGGTLTTGTYKF